jgi:predicted  nucleic acid-binding Zn-ribbon protein
LSTLTKVLIVLLTLASIFLCGIVVTYVASAVDYKEKFDNQQNRYQAAERRADSADRNFNDLKDETVKIKLDLNNQIAALQERINGLQADLKQCQIDRDDARRKEDSWEAAAKDFSKTVAMNDKLRADAEAELKQTKADLIKERSEHEQTTDALMTKMAVIDDLEARTKRLIEEKTELQSKLNEMLQQYGKITASSEPVTPMKSSAQVAPGVKDINLQGIVTDVEPQERLAEISIGQAEGVKKGMRFHVTRDDKYICDIVILDVMPEKSTGWLEMLQAGLQNQPRVDDTVRTNL